MQKCNGNNIIEYIKYSDRIVRKLCREKGIYGDLKEQLLSEGIVGLARALKNYNIKKVHLFKHIFIEMLKMKLITI